MCIFTGDVEKVSDTSIFASAEGARQRLVYSMAYAAGSELAMVLPLPVPPGAPEDAVRFVSLEGCPDFFAHLRKGFPVHTEHDEVGATLSADTKTRSRTLAVHEVGAFEASFVPRPEDFGRLDERFRLPAELWLELSRYRDWGFAVFKLKPSSLAQVHPMALEFPRRDRERLFFPTMHIHARRVHGKATFDHTLYCQPEPAQNWHLHGWEDSLRPARDFVDCAEAMQLLDPAFPCWRAFLEGRRENRDSWLGKGERLPAAA